MSDSHLINRRALLIQETINSLPEPLAVQRATGTSHYSEYGDLYVDNILITDAIYCPSSAYNILSSGRLFGGNPTWQ